MKSFLLIFSFAITCLTFGQDYSEIDSIVTNYPNKFKSIKHFANRIECDFETDIEKTRAVYFWIGNNISYDFKSYRNKKEVYKRIYYDTEEEYQTKQLEQEKKYAEQCLKRNKAICEGYSLLLKFTLEYLDIKCEFITGFSKSTIQEVGRNRSATDHAWNAVMIDNEWKLLDVTWSTGNREFSSDEFEFDDTYFFSDPKQFILDHFPKNEKWQLLNIPVKKSDFFLLPNIFTPFFKTEIDLGRASVGIIKVKPNDSIELAFNKVDIDKFYRYSFKKESSKKFLFEKIGDEFVVKIPFKLTRPTTLTLYFDDKAIIEYKVLPTK